MCLSGFVSVCFCVSMSYRGLGILGTLTELDCPSSRIRNPPVVSQEIWKLDKLKLTNKIPCFLNFLEVIRLIVVISEYLHFLGGGKTKIQTKVNFKRILLTGNEDTGAGDCVSSENQIMEGQIVYLFGVFCGSFFSCWFG